MLIAPGANSAAVILSFLLSLMELRLFIKVIISTLSCACLIYVYYLFLITTDRAESPKWLLQNQRASMAYQTLRRMADTNKRVSYCRGFTCSHEFIESELFVEVLHTQVHKVNTSTYLLYQIFFSLLIIIISTCRIFTGL